MLIKKFSVGDLGTNCYLVADETTKECILIDTGDVSNELDSYICEQKLTVKYIVFTHGHFDHTDGVNYYFDKFKCEILIHTADAVSLTDVNSVYSLGYSKRNMPVKPSKFLCDGDVVSFGKCELKVIHTPGHTLGGICLYSDGILISGDTLFYRSVGRTDFWGGKFETLQQSILKLYKLPDETVVYPGHGGSTTIGDEKHNNPFVREK